jgi:hypothetical protein
MGSASTLGLSFFGGKSIYEYFMDKSGAIRDFFTYAGALQIIKIYQLPSRR